ncbi:MAG: hypothetical protein Kow00109_30330 [Acidobacteriota bacterium]
MRHLSRASRLGLFCAFLLAPVLAGVSDEIEQEYRTRYENKALFLRRPVWTVEQVVAVPEGREIESSGAARAPLFRVTDQVRITKVDFKDQEVEFTLSSVDLSRQARLRFRFPRQLTYTFAQRADFDRVLDAWFTEGLTYRELEEARRRYIQQEFRRTLEVLAGTSGADSEFVKNAVADAQPEFARVREELASLQERYRALQAENEDLEQRVGTLESELRQARAGLAAARESAAGLEQERDRLRRELETLQATLARLQRDNSAATAQLRELSERLNLELGSNTQLSRQIDELSRRLEVLAASEQKARQEVERLGQELEKLRKERDELRKDLTSTRTALQRAERRLQDLTSDRNSLEARFVRVQDERDRLVTAQRLADALRLVVTGGAEGGSAGGLEGELYLLSRRLGSWRVWVEAAEAGPRLRYAFRTESPNLVQFSEEERALFEALGETLQVAVVARAWREGQAWQAAEAEEVKPAPVREAVEWSWSPALAIEQPEWVQVRLTLRTAAGLPVSAGDVMLKVEPADLWYRLLIYAPWLVAAAAAAVGLGVGVGIGRRRRREAAQAPPVRVRRETVRKEL